MIQLLNTLYINREECYLAVEGEAVKVLQDNTVLARYPLLNLESIVTHGYTGVSPGLIHKCQEYNISILFMNHYGAYQGRLEGKIKGNVLLRREQFRQADDLSKSCFIARNIVFAKTYNQIGLLDRMCRDHKMRLQSTQVKDASKYLKSTLSDLRTVNELETLRGIEGKNAQVYFSVFDDLILQKDSGMVFKGRSRRPPEDNVNALLSYLYTVLSHHVASALEAVGLDPYVGFYHRDRPGRLSLALDIMEEFRSAMVDRLVLRLINRGEISSKDFICREDGAVSFNENTRKKVLAAWQYRKKEELVHPFLKEKIEWGLTPYVQSLLLSRYIRGDLDEYPSLLYKV